MTSKLGIARSGLITYTHFVCSALLLTGFAGMALAQTSLYPALSRSNFTSLVGTAAGSEQGEGFNDRQNSWAWSMAWFQGKLLVGTARAEVCVNDAAIHNQFPSLQAYPPDDPDIYCTPDYTDLPLQAQIWSWDPSTNLWTEVYQSPADIPIPNTNPVKYVARDIGYRGMLVYTETDGTQALYVGSCSSRALYGTAVPPGRILRSVDGVNFTPVPQDPGTFLGNIGSACFRGSEQFNGKFYGVATNYKGEGILVESANPQLGDNSFRQVSPFGEEVYEFSVFNNALYISTTGSQGFSIYKTSATGNLPYSYKLIFANGGYNTSYPNQIAVSMKVFNGYLYIGGDGVNAFAPFFNQAAELFRVKADDSWDLIAGKSRSTPDGKKNALSGLSAGFGWPLNEHMWRMEVYDGRLYVGTFDASTAFRNDPQVGSYLTPELGADLWYTSDGTTFSNIDYQGFEDEFNFGFRSLLSTPYGLFVGTANYYYGLEVWQGIPTGFTSPSGKPNASARISVPDAPSGLQLEGGPQSALLSWRPSQRNVRRYLVYRSDTSQLQSGSARELIGTTTGTFFVDKKMMPGSTYVYRVAAESAGGEVSDASNIAEFPSQLPPAAFSDVTALLRQYEAQGRFVSAAARQTVFSLVGVAEAAAQKGNFAPLNDLWKTVANSGSALLSGSCAEDVAMLLGRLAGRSQLVSGGVLPLGSL